jgi:phospholipid/cholesterol/gamma-HCH transport system substrate-binding protein
MTRASRDLLIGLTAVGGLLVVAWMLMRFGELAGVGVSYRRVVLRAESARGISPVAPVTYSGVRIGDVTEIRLAPDGSGDALIAVRYRDSVEIPSAFDIFLDASFVGDATLDIEPRPGWDGSPTPGAGEEHRVEVRSLTSTLERAVTTRLDRFDTTAARIDTLAETYTEVGRRLATVLDSGGKGEADIRSLLVRIETVLDQTDRWLADGALLRDIRSAVERWELAASTISAQSESIGARADRTLTAVSGAADELRDLTARINRGEGTLGQLATNADLYRSLEAAAEQLRALLRDARLLIEKFRDEGVPINL